MAMRLLSRFTAHTECPRPSRNSSCCGHVVVVHVDHLSASKQQLATQASLTWVTSTRDLPKVEHSQATS